MSYFGSGVEQGLHCLLMLAGRAGEATPSVRDLAEFQGVSVSFVAKLFTRLGKAGIVQSGEGIHGGFRLARPARDITVLEAVDALEGEKPLFRCREIRRNCILYGDRPPRWATSGICGIHQTMRDAEAAMRDVLAGVTLQDLIDRTDRKRPAAARQRTAEWFAGRHQARGPHR